ncbi:MAG TPA: DUF4167 domain-containing protein [Hyphomicrobium sp.]|nr:DUF4167 domain-containing protein [Hyphomicrobium sp.]
MRQGQQNRRGRGRNRKSQNPLTRSFESTGPDVKLRGTPSHIAEKYMSLARDALSSGDPVLAENYMQHAEHYNRIIMSFREQQMSQGGGDPFASGLTVARGPMMPGDPLDAGDDFGEDEGEDFGEGRQGQPDLGQMTQPQGQPSGQPRNLDQPGQQRYDSRQQHHRRDRGDQQHRHGSQRHDRESRFDRPERGEFRGDRMDRQDRGDRNGDRADRPERGEFRGDRPDRPERNTDLRQVREDRPDRLPQPVVSEGMGEQPSATAPRRRERFQPANSNGEALQPAAAVSDHQPEFLRRPVRRPRAEPASEEGGREGAREAARPPRQQAGEDQE